MIIVDWMSKVDRASLRVVSPVTVRQQVVDQLREAIALGRFKLGERLIERELCELTRTSRTSMREALRQLESEGLVTNVPHRGPIVTPVSAKTAKEIYDLRIVMEGLAARLFASNATSEQQRELAQSVDCLEKVYIDFNALRFLETKAKFYEILLAGAGNEILAANLRNLHIRVSQLRAVSLTRPGRGRESILEIRTMLAALQARDAEAAWNACTFHVERAAEVALSVLADNQPLPEISQIGAYGG